MQYFEMDCPCKGKNLDKLLQPSVLKILYNKSLHGFAIVSELSEGAMCAGVQPDAAGVYRYLKKMEASGLLTSSWDTGAKGDKPIKMYEITAKGKACLMSWKIALNEYRHCIEGLLDEIDQLNQ